MLHTRSLALLVALSGLALPGCTTDPGSSQPAFSYDAKITGAVNRTIQGDAGFVRGTTGYGGPMVAIVLRAAGQTDRILLETGGLRPAVGAAPVEPGTEPQPGAWLATYQIYQNGEIAATFFATQGEVRIVESANGRLRGIFWFEGTGELPGEVGLPVQLTVRGTFDAGLRAGS